MYTVKSIIKSLPLEGQIILGDLKTAKYIEWYKEDSQDGGLTGLTEAEAIVVKNFIDRFCKDNFFESTVCVISEEVIPDGLFIDDSSSKFPAFYPLEQLIGDENISAITFKLKITGYNRFLEGL